MQTPSEPAPDIEKLQEPAPVPKTAAVARPRADRSAVLLQGSLLIGARWAHGWCEEMVRNGRPVAGGWPGTLPEARARVAAHFEREFARRGMLRLSPDELAVATRAMYDKAKQEWLSAQFASPARREGRSGSNQ